MNRNDKGNEAWTEAFRNSYLSEPVPGESGDGWATVSSLAARRQTRRRLLGVAAALLPLFIAGGLGLGLGLGSDTQTADGALVADGSSDANIEENIYLADEIINLADGSADANTDATIEENIKLANENIYLADSSGDGNIVNENIYLADGGDDAKTYAGEEIYPVENEKLMPDNERIVP